MLFSHSLHCISTQRHHGHTFTHTYVLLLNVLLVLNCFFFHCNLHLRQLRSFPLFFLSTLAGSVACCLRLSPGLFFLRTCLLLCLFACTCAYMFVVFVQFCDLSPSPSLEHLYLLYQAAHLALVQVVNSGALCSTQCVFAPLPSCFCAFRMF